MALEAHNVRTGYDCATHFAVTWPKHLTNARALVTMVIDARAFRAHSRNAFCGLYDAEPGRAELALAAFCAN